MVIVNIVNVIVTKQGINHEGQGRAIDSYISISPGPALPSSIGMSQRSTRRPSLPKLSMGNFIEAVKYAPLTNSQSLTVVLYYLPRNPPKSLCFVKLISSAMILHRSESLHVEFPQTA